MIYFANPTTGTRDAMQSGALGFIDTPAQGNTRPDGVAWCADNGAYSNNFDEKRWWKFLVNNSPHADTCVFAVAPDVVGDAAATIQRSTSWLPKIRALGYPAAFVAQDGQENLPVPWDEFDVLFIGGTTEWKMSAAVKTLIREAKTRRLHVHFGRVNSEKRYRYAEAIGCDSCDGTYLVFAPDINLPKLLGWVERLQTRPALFDWRTT